MSGERSWLGAHLHFDGQVFGCDGDRVIAEIVASFVRRATHEGWIDRHFFVRYREAGPHIRLRVRGEPQLLAGTVQPALILHINETHHDLGGMVAAHFDVNAQAPIQVAVEWVPYEPETMRYGGHQALDIAEQLFEASSDLAVTLLSNLRGDDKPLRLGRALLAMLVLLHGFVGQRTRAVAFLTSCGQHYLRGWTTNLEIGASWSAAFERGYFAQATTLAVAVDHFWSYLESGGRLPPEMESFRVACGTAFAELERVCHEGRFVHGGRRIVRTEDMSERVLPSFVHMMHNRIGLAAAEEAYLAHVGARALATWSGASE